VNEVPNNFSTYSRCLMALKYIIERGSSDAGI